MWLDRFSGNNSPSASIPPPHNRSYSPGTRRPIHLGPNAAARPNFSQRSSSLYLGSKSNLSTTSINSNRAPNGSALKNEITPPGELSDPLKVLAEILGRHLPSQPPKKTTKFDVEDVDRPTCLIEDVNFDGLSLYEFSQADFPPENEEQRRVRFSVPSARECEYVLPSAFECMSNLM